MRVPRNRLAVGIGGGSGMGRGPCRGFAAEGLAVAVADEDRASAEETTGMEPDDVAPLVLAAFDALPGVKGGAW